MYPQLHPADDSAEIVEMTSGLSDEASNIEIEAESPNQEDEDKVKILKEKKEGRKKLIKTVNNIILITALVVVVCIYVFVNMKLVGTRDSCRRNISNSLVYAKLVEKNDWYVFRYKGHECVAPPDFSLAGKESNTSIPVYFSDNYKHCSLSKPSDTKCEWAIYLFNFLYPIFGIMLTLSIVRLICLTTCLYCFKVSFIHE